MSVRGGMAALAVLALSVGGGCRPPESELPAAMRAGVRVSIYQRVTSAGEAEAATHSRAQTVVVERRWVELKRGRSRISLDRVSEGLDVSTAWLSSLTDADGVRVDGMVFEPGAGGEPAINERRGSARLVVEVDARRGGRHLLEFAYVTTGLSWKADHHVDVSRDDRGVLRAELASYATVTNESGVAFENAEVDLYAGTLGSGATARRVWRGSLALARRQSERIRLSVSTEPQPARIAYLYRGALPDRSKEDRGPAFGTRSQGIVRERLLFDNPGVGAAGVMPPGQVSVRIRASDEQDSRHLFSVLPAQVPRGSEVPVDLGPAPGLEGERQQLSVRRSTDGTTVTERYRLGVENRRGEPVAVTVVEPLARSGRATIVSAEPAGMRRGREVHFEFELAPGKRARADLEVIYSW